MYKKHGYYGTRQYNTFLALKNRCENIKNKDYKLYGGRGIKCEWKNFIDFWNDMKKGYKNNLTIDRINTDGNYCKENCRWITNLKQQSNKRNNIFVTYKGKTKHLAYWEKISGLKKSTFRERYKRDWTIEQIMETPLISCKDKKIDNGKKVH